MWAWTFKTNSSNGLLRHWFMKLEGLEQIYYLTWGTELCTFCSSKKKGEWIVCVCMCMCLCIGMFVCIFVYKCVSVYVCILCVCMCVRLCRGVFMYSCMCVFVCRCICVCMCICVCACVCAYTCLCVYLCVWIFCMSFSLAFDIHSAFWESPSLYTWGLSRRLSWLAHEPQGLSPSPHGWDFKHLLPDLALNVALRTDLRLSGCLGLT